MVGQRQKHQKREARFHVFEAYRIPRRVSQAYAVLLEERRSIHDVVTMLDESVQSKVAQEISEIDLDGPAYIHYEPWHREAINFIEQLIFSRIVDALNFYLDDINCLIEIASKGSGSIGDGRCIFSSEVDAANIAASSKKFSRLNFPEKLRQLEKAHGLDVRGMQGVAEVRRIRNSRNAIVHGRGIAQGLIARFATTKEVEIFQIEQPFLEPAGANVKHYISAMEHILTFCGELDVAVQKKHKLRTWPVKLQPKNWRHQNRTKYYKPGAPELDPQPTPNRASS